MHPAKLLCPWGSPGKNTGVGILKIPISFRGSSWPRDWTRVSCTAGSFFTSYQGSPPSAYTLGLMNSTTNKASGGDGIPVELFQILKDDAMKVLHSICQQIWKIHQWPQDWKRSVSIPIPKKGSAKECSSYRTIALITHTSKVMLKILQARLQQYVNFQMIKLVFRCSSWF